MTPDELSAYLQVLRNHGVQEFVTTTWTVRFPGAQQVPKRAGVSIDLSGEEPEGEADEAPEEEPDFRFALERLGPANLPGQGKRKTS